MDGLCVWVGKDDHISTYHKGCQQQTKVREARTKYLSSCGLIQGCSSSKGQVVGPAGMHEQ